MTDAGARRFPEIQPLFHAFITAGKAPGVAYAAVRRDEVIASGGAGIVSVESDAIPSADNTFRIASMTKSFTAAAVLQLRDAGQLALDDAVSRYVPELAGFRGATADAPDITLRHLLTMTAGFPTDDPWGDRQQALPIDEFRRFLATHPEPVWTAGTTFEYSNMGYAILGLVLAAVSGRPYRELIRERLLVPLGMHSSAFDSESVPPHSFVPGYVKRDEAWLPEPVDAYGAFAPMGGLISSPRDIARWASFLIDAFRGRDEAGADEPGGAQPVDTQSDTASQAAGNAPLSRASRREMQQIQRVFATDPSRRGPRKPATAAGYGFGLFAEYHPRVGYLVGHSGGYPGYGSHMRWHPDTGIGVVVLANGRYAPASEVAREALVRLVLGSGEPVVRRVQPTAATVAARESLDRLVTEWDDTEAQRLFAGNVELDEPIERRRSALAALIESTGDLSPDPRRPATSASPSEMVWWLHGQRGDAKAEIMLSPERPPRIQAFAIKAADPPTFELDQEVLRIALRDPFRIARTHGDRLITVVATSLRHVEFADLEGLGEAYPDTYYGETAETIEIVLPLLLGAVRALGRPPDVTDGANAALEWLGRASAATDAAIRHHGGAKAGLDIALHDLLARRLDLPLWQLLGLSPEIPPTDFSIGIDEPALVAERAARARTFPFLKIKLGGASDIETLEAVRAVFPGPLRVDANTGWQPEEGARLIPELVRLGVELVEQPFPAHEIGQLRWLQERSALPIVTDESSVTLDDLERLVGVVQGVNVKLTKCGGIGPAVRMLRRARELGFKTMLGCMEETSVGIAAGAAIASLADWVDLDGNLLLAEDPYVGLELGADCRWQLGDSPGLGVRRRVAPPAALV